MKFLNLKITLAISLLLLANSSFSQAPTLTAAGNSPTFGASWTFQNADTTGISEGPSGANITWNFSNAVASGAVVNNTYLDPASTPYIADFAGATIASGGSGTPYAYMKITANDWKLMGTETSGYFFSMSDDEILMQFPLTYNGTFTDNVVGTSVIGGGASTSYRTGSISLLADAWGTVVTPAGAFSDCLRLKHIQHYADSSNGFVTITDLTSYTWMKPNYIGDVFQVYYISTTILGNTTYGKSVGYGTNVPSAINEINTVTLNLYPNPADEKVLISFNDQQKYQIDVLNTMGQVVSTLSDVTFNGEIATDKLAAGIYFVKATGADGKSLNQKLVIN